MFHLLLLIDIQIDKLLYEQQNLIYVIYICLIRLLTKFYYLSVVPFPLAKKQHLCLF